MRSTRALSCLAVAALCSSASSVLLSQQTSVPDPRFNVAHIDRSVSPCDDFYAYACGGWIAKNPIPPDRSRWGRFSELGERNLATLREILETASKDPKSNPTSRLIGDAYAACMDEPAIDGAGLKPLRPELDAIEALRSAKDLPSLVGRLHSSGVPVFFGFGSEQDFKEPTQIRAIADQGGLGLPDRDYYFKDDPKSKDLREKYVAHVAKMLELSGEPAGDAAKNAKTVMDLETALANASLDVVSRRDPNNLYHKMTLAELQALTPGFAWDRYLLSISAPAITALNVTSPDFFKAMNGHAGDDALGRVRPYLKWQTLHAAAPLLPSAFVKENFAFYGIALTGAKELRPRWKRCVDRVDSDLGDALGQAFVEKTFGAEGKARMQAMVAALEKSLQADIRSLTWMTDPTKAKALGKLAAFAKKIGYPDRWRDYSTVRIVRSDAVANARSAAGFEVKRQMDKIGKPLDRGEWDMSPPTVNANYNPLRNDINFPAGILQPPFFDRSMDDPVNFGGIGAVIGHEMTHGFDDQGRQFAADGSLSDWWTDADAKEFESRAACVADQYGSYTAIDDVKLNGKLTLGENVADNAGVRIALQALRDTLSNKKVAPVDGFTPEQRFFLGYAQVWCENSTPELARLRAQVDPHSPARYRANGVVSNMSEFAQAFSCGPKSAMVREKACRVW